MNNVSKVVGVPHLTTASSAISYQIEQHILERQPLIEGWFRRQWQQLKMPFYSSVDIRHAGFKLAPVDTNLFPAGFNNLNPVFQPMCIQAMQFALSIEQIGIQVDKILIVPEQHTRNKFYLESLAVLGEMVEKAGFEIRYGSLNVDLSVPLSIELADGKHLSIQPMQRDGRYVKVQDFTPDLILLNNDLSSGHPAILDDLAQPITPSAGLGWSQRLKSVYFSHYQRVATNFANLLELDPWFIQPLFRNCGEVDFMQRKGSDCLRRNVSDLFAMIEQKYASYQVEQRPFVIMKADAGTYGMSVMTLYSADEIEDLNRKQRTKMAKTKEGQQVNKVILQEGIYTHETWQQAGAVAEPVVYMIDHHVVGGFYRVHADRKSDENLNAPGMRFEPLAFDDCCIAPDSGHTPDAHQNRFYAYGVIARLAALAAAYEMQDIERP